MRKGVLFIGYDGMLEPLGQSQVLAYVERLAHDRPIHLLSFEKLEDWAQQAQRDEVAARIARAGIHWHPRRYHKWPTALATGWDIAVGIATGLWVVLRHRVGIVHARSYVPAVMALAIKRLTGVNLVFDMRGFWADERVDGGLWPREGRMYRLAKWFERRFLLRADHVVSLTHSAVHEMQSFDYLAERMPPFTVIPTCADLAKFAPHEKPSGSFVLGYVGSAGTWYLFDAVVASFAQLQQLNPEARLLIINRNDHDYVRACLKAGNVSHGAVELRSATHSEVPAQIARMHAGVFFYKPSYSRAACAPTKLAEFLGCGIPCLSNQGVGDMAQILEVDRVGVALSDLKPSSLRDGVSRLLDLAADPSTSERCVASAHRHFSLQDGVDRYAQVYRSLDCAS